MAIEVKLATLEDNAALVNQYISIRANAGHNTLPNHPIKGDRSATFLLGVDGDVVRAGLRLSEVKECADEGNPKGWLPIDKVPAARLESLFPDNPEIAEAMRNKRDGYKILYVDGVASNFSLLEMSTAVTVQKKMLGTLSERMRSENYAMIYCFPKKSNARSIQHFFERVQIPYCNLGPQPYTSHDQVPRGNDRSLLLFFNNQKLMEYARKTSPDLQER